jgi:hypothetical protein
MSPWGRAGVRCEGGLAFGLLGFEVLFAPSGGRPVDTGGGTPAPTPAKVPLIVSLSASTLPCSGFVNIWLGEQHLLSALLWNLAKAGSCMLPT